MTGSNRRTLISGAAAGLLMAIPLLRSGGSARSAINDREVESSFTGSVIELVDDQWTFEDTYPLIEEADFRWEAISIRNDSSVVQIEFIDTSMSLDEYVNDLQEQYRSSYDTFDIVDSGASNDGAWFVLSLAYEGISLSGSVYCEYQTGAYEEFDLVITVNSPEDELPGNLYALQGGILIDDNEPLMMLETSGVAPLTFPPGTASSTTSGRSKRPSQTSNTTETSTAQTNAPDRSFVDSVRTHRSAFLETIIDFTSALTVIDDDDSDDADKAVALVVMDNQAALWVEYAAQAAQLRAPAEFAELEDLYLSWADEITELGITWQEIQAGTRQNPTLFEQLDDVYQADKELEAALDAL